MARSPLPQRFDIPRKLGFTMDYAEDLRGALLHEATIRDVPVEGRDSVTPVLGRADVRSLLTAEWTHHKDANLPFDPEFTLEVVVNQENAAAFHRRNTATVRLVGTLGISRIYRSTTDDPLCHVSLLAYSPWRDPSHLLAVTRKSIAESYDTVIPPIPADSADQFIAFPLVTLGLATPEAHHLTREVTDLFTVPAQATLGYFCATDQ